MSSSVPQPQATPAGSDTTTTTVQPVSATTSTQNTSSDGAAFGSEKKYIPNSQRQDATEQSKSSSTLPKDTMSEAAYEARLVRFAPPNPRPTAQILLTAEAYLATMDETPPTVEKEV